MNNEWNITKQCINCITIKQTLHQRYTKKMLWKQQRMFSCNELLLFFVSHSYRYNYKLQKMWWLSQQYTTIWDFNFHKKRNCLFYSQSFQHLWLFKFSFPDDLDTLSRWGFIFKFSAGWHFLRLLLLGSISFATSTSNTSQNTSIEITFIFSKMSGFSMF